MGPARPPATRWLSLPPAVAALLALACPPALATPIVQILSPQNGARITGQFSIQISASGSPQAPIARIDLLIDNVPITSLNLNPPQAQLKTSLPYAFPNPDNRQHSISVRATDTTGAIAQAIIHVTAAAPQPPPGPGPQPAPGTRPQAPDVTPPIVNITSPRDGQVVWGTVEVRVEAMDDSAVRWVFIRVDGEPKALLSKSRIVWQWDTTQSPEGPHVIQAEARDNAGNVGRSAPVRVIVRRGPPPSPPSQPQPVQPTQPGQAQPQPAQPAATAPSQPAQPSQPQPTAPVTIPVEPSQPAPQPPAEPRPATAALAARLAAVRPSLLPSGMPASDIPPAERPKTPSPATASPSPAPAAKPAAASAQPALAALPAAPSRAPSAAAPAIASMAAAPSEKPASARIAAAAMPTPSTPPKSAAIAPKPAAVPPQAPPARIAARPERPPAPPAAPAADEPAGQTTPPASYAIAAAAPSPGPVRFVSLSAPVSAGPPRQPRFTGLAVDPLAIRRCPKPLLVVEGNPIKPSAPLQVRGAAIMVPARDILAPLKVPYAWQASERTLCIRLPDAVARLRLDAPEARVGERRIALSAAPYLADGTVMVPLDFLTSLLGLSARFDSSSKTLIIWRTKR